MFYQLGRYGIALLLGIAGYVASYSFMPILFPVAQRLLQWTDNSATNLIVAIACGILSLLVGFLCAPYLLTLGTSLTKRLEHILTRFSGQDLLFGTIGLAFGLIIANLIGLAFRNIPIVGPYIPVVLSAMLGYLGMHLMVRKRTDIVGYWQERIGERFPSRKTGMRLPALPEKVVTETQCDPAEWTDGKLLDTSVIIDGRIGSLCHTGFLEGTLIVPLFVIEELQKLSDSSDAGKRARGRRGLDLLNGWQEDDRITLELLDEDVLDTDEVDAKLLRLAVAYNWKLVTNDFNLNKVAHLQGIGVLSLHDLAQAMKPISTPGESMTVQVVKQGKEAGQGLAYLEDGTMIVVEQGMAHLHETIPVVVTSVIQTRAGRMIFARPEEVSHG